MATRELQTINNSGELTNHQLGGVTGEEKVVVFSDLTASNVDFDNSSTSLAATTSQTALVELANVGLGHMVLATPYAGGQTVGLTPVKISLFDTISHNINGAVTPVVDTNEATPAHSFTIDKSGLFSVYGVVNAEFSSSAAISLILYKNGSPISPNVELQGRGATKPVMFTYVDLVDLVATDVLEVYAVSDTASTSLLITASSMIIERKPLA